MTPEPIYNAITVTKFVGFTFNPDNYLIHVCQLLLALTNILGPILYILGQYFLNKGTFTYKSAYKSYRIVELFFALSSIEPFLISVFVAML